MNNLGRFIVLLDMENVVPRPTYQGILFYDGSLQTKLHSKVNTFFISGGWAHKMGAVMFFLK